MIWKCYERVKEFTNLQLIADVDDKCIRDVIDIEPVAVFKELKALNRIGNKDGYGGHISMSDHTKN